MHASPRSLLQGWLLRYGVANFFEQGVYGPIGCGGLSSIKDRQYEHHTSLSPELLDCFSILESIIQSRPERLFPIVARLFVPLLTLLWISPERAQVVSSSSGRMMPMNLVKLLSPKFLIPSMIGSARVRPRLHNLNWSKFCLPLWPDRHNFEVDEAFGLLTTLQR